MADDPAREYFVRRAIYRITQRAVEAVNQIVSKGPLSPLTDTQNLTLRVALANLLREALSVGRWFERARAGSKEPPPLPRAFHQPSKTVIVADDPKFDEEATTEPVHPRKRDKSA